MGRWWSCFVGFVESVEMEQGVVVLELEHEAIDGHELPLSDKEVKSRCIPDVYDLLC